MTRLPLAAVRLDQIVSGGVTGLPGGLWLGHGGQILRFTQVSLRSSEKSVTVLPAPRGVR